MINTIYIITNKTNKKQYVGQTWNTIKNRWMEHCCPSETGCKKLHRAIKKYGKENFDIYFLTVCGTQETANYWEDFFIEKYNTIKTGYNLRKGGSRGKHTEATKKKISKAKKGQKHTAETKQKIGDANRGRIPSEETKNKLSIALMGKNKGKPSPLKNTKKSLETLQRMSDAHKGIKSSKRMFNEQQILYIRSMKGKKSHRKLAKEMGTTKGSIQNILNYKTYK
jgi:group I intron endonuclease